METTVEVVQVTPCKSADFSGAVKFGVGFAVGTGIVIGSILVIRHFLKKKG